MQPSTGAAHAVPNQPFEGEESRPELCHQQLWQVCKRLPGDYEPYGTQERVMGDCSSGCKWYHTLTGEASYDWGVCGNPKSHRAGLLTFEHQGCPLCEQE